MVVNYRAVPWTGLLVWLIFVTICLVGLPIYVIAHYGLEVGSGFHGGNVIVAPFMGAFYIFLVWRTMRFNVRIRREPRALQWDRGGITLWRDGTRRTCSWSQIAEINLQTRKGTCLEVKASGERTPNIWRFTPDRLSLSDLTMARLARMLEQARMGSVALTGEALDGEAALAEERKERSAEKARAKGRVWAYFFMMLIVSGAIMMMSEIANPTTLLTAADPRIWLAAQMGFFFAPVAVLLIFAKALWNAPRITSNVAFVVILLTLLSTPGGLFTGAWAYEAAKLYVTHKTFGSGEVQRKVELFKILPTRKKRNGKYNLTVAIPYNGDRQVSFTVDPNDFSLFERQTELDRRLLRWCLAVPIEKSGSAVRADAAYGVAIRRGSVRLCE